MQLTPIQKLRLENLRNYAIIGWVIGCLVGLVYPFFITVSYFEILLRAGLLGFLLGISLNLIELFIAKKKYERLSFLSLFIIQSTFITAITAFLLSIINTLTDPRIHQDGFLITVKDYILEGTYRYDIIVALVLSVITTAVLRIGKLHSKGMLFKYITGRFHHPTETKRIFLFIDLTSSTALAEKLGNLKYSAFCRDFFFDITEGILLSKGEIYQYLGDGVIISWPWEKGIKNANCITCFFHIQDSLEKEKNKYMKKFSVFPVFKAGIHGGNAVVSWVGEIKRDIIYHGEVLNTAARLEGACNRLESQFLISESLRSEIKLPDYLQTEYKDEILLRGKSNKIKIFSIVRSTNDNSE